MLEPVIFASLITTPGFIGKANEIKMDKITNDIYMFSGFGRNVTALVTG